MCVRVVFFRCVFYYCLPFSVFTLSGDVVTVTTPSDCRWLQVEFRPHGGGGEGEKEEERKKIKVPATGNMVSNFCAAVFFCLAVSSSSFVSSFTHCFVLSKNQLVMFKVSLLQLLCEVKQRAIEELQLLEQPPGKPLILNNCTPAPPTHTHIISQSVIMDYIQMPVPVGICFKNTATQCMHQVHLS